MKLILPGTTTPANPADLVLPGASPEPQTSAALVLPGRPPVRTTDAVIWLPLPGAHNDYRSVPVK